MARVAVIGLDGATWDLLKPWAEAGNLPAFATLMSHGVWGELQSTVPPVTGPAWISLATGLNPGKTGVFDFLTRRDNRYKLHPISSDDFHRRALWDYVTLDGSKRAAVLNYPLLFPPYALNGIIVCNIAFSGTGDLTFPRDLRVKLDEVCGGYESRVPYHDRKYDDTGLFLEDLNRVLDKQMKALRYLMRQPWDLLVYVLSLTDWAQHLMWKYIDSSHPSFESVGAQKYGPELLRFWRRIDGFLKGIVETGQGANIFLVSDHGFGPQDECFNLAKWLENKGYLVRKSSKGEVTYSGAKKLAAFILNPLAKTKLRRAIPERFAREIWRGLKINVTRKVDFARSKAYVLGHSVPFGAIYINRQGRDPQGCIKNEEYEALKAEIVDKLRNLKQDTGKAVQVEIFDTQEIYSGSYVDRAPDIVFTIDNWRCVINERRLDDVLFKNEPYSNRHTGSHRMNGLFLAYGPDVKNTGEELKGLKIYDIAPTVLHMFGIPIPRDVDGKVLKAIFKEDSEPGKREIKYSQAMYEKDRLLRRIRQLKAVGEV